MSLGISKQVDDEVTAVLKSAERHPHNYYAWQYLRRLLTATMTQQSGPDRRTSLRSVQDRTLAWTLRHPSDVSGWSFLSFVLRLGDQAAGSTTKAIVDVKRFAETLQWKGQGLHDFLKEAEDERNRAFAADIAWRDSTES